jgi:aldose 1-epimerase
VEKVPFGHDPSGTPVWLFRLRNGHGTAVAITNYGAIVQSIVVADRNGCLADIVLGFADLEGYLRHPSTYFGAILGRYASRIRGAAFELGGRRITLAANNGHNSLHGGLRGFDKRTWNVDKAQENSLTLSYSSADGEEGYPGNLHVRVNYSLNEENEFRVAIEAETDAETVINLTDHSDFNLAGEGHGDVLKQRLTLAADRFLPVEEGLAPTGELRSVTGMAFDFREARAIGDGMQTLDEQLRLAGGYDHTFVLSNWDGTLRLAARVHDPASGRIVELHTTQPGVHFYSGNFLDGSILRKSGAGKSGTGNSGGRYEHRGTFYLGAQHFPDSPNQPAFPSTVLRPGEVFRSTNLYRFSVDSTNNSVSRVTK